MEGFQEFRFSPLLPKSDQGTPGVARNPFSPEVLNSIETLLKGPLWSLMGSIEDSYQEISGELGNPLSLYKAEHESYLAGDKLMRKDEIEMFDICTRLGYGLSQIYSPSYLPDPLERSSSRSRARSRGRSWKILLIVESLRLVLKHKSR